MEQYYLKTRLNSGTSGVVWSAKLRNTSELYAVKKFHLDEATDLTAVNSQLKLAGRLNHKNLVKMLGVIRQGRDVHLIMEYCKGDDLENTIVTRSTMSRGGLPRKAVASYTWQMLSGVAYLHHFSIAHRDIKPRHFVIEGNDDSHDTLKLLDFSQACLFSKGKPMVGTVGTPFFQSPEMIQGSYTEKCDIWSLGIVCYMLMVRQYPFMLEASPGVAAMSPEAVQRDVLAKRAITFDNKEWTKCPEAKALTQELLAWTEEERPSAKVAMRTSEWLREQRATGNPCCSTM